METSEEVKNKSIFLIAFILFFYNARRFLYEEKLSMSIPNSLLNIIFYLLKILISFHKDDPKKLKRN